MKHWLMAATFVTVLIAAYALPLAVTLHAAAVATQPGDRLVVAFSPDTPVPVALERLGRAGTAIAGAAWAPWFYSVEVLDAAAGQRLAAQAWLMRWPTGSQTFAGCFVPPTTQQSRPRGW